MLLAARYRILGVLPEDILKAGLRVLLIFVLAFTAVRVARRAVPRAIGKLAHVTASADERLLLRTRTLSGTVVSVVAVVVWATALFTVLGQLDIDLGPLLAGAGIVGLAVGFGAQQLVRDVITGFFVLVEDQYGVGDSITAGGVSGTVESMTLRMTRIRGDDGVLHHVRNGDLGTVSNASRGYNVATVTVPLPDDADPARIADRVSAAMAELVEAGELDDLLLADPKVLGVTGFREQGGGAVLTLTARVRPEARAAVQRTLLQRALAAVPEPATSAGRRRPR